MSLLVTVLTGQRPELLERTLTAVETHQPSLCGATWLVCHNGGDDATWDVLQRHRNMISRVVVTPTFMDVGPAASFLFQEAQNTDHMFLLHLEDDWEAEPGDWIIAAQRLLGDGMFQVRLRRSDERVKLNHMVTGAPLHWLGHQGWRETADAHYTLNPSLMWLDDLRHGFPAVGERDAQRKFWAAGQRRVAQLIPGVWRHIGGDDSLRKRR